MTSFTRKLYNLDPAAYAAFMRAQEYDRQLVYGKAPTLACFSPSWNGKYPLFGKRAPARQFACSQNCGSPACSNGCTLVDRVRNR